MFVPVRTISIDLLSFSLSFFFFLLKLHHSILFLTNTNLFPLRDEPWIPFLPISSLALNYLS